MALLGDDAVRDPAALRLKEVSTVAVAGFAAVTLHESCPFAETLIVDVTLPPCVTVTSLTVAVTSAVMSSAADAETAPNANVTTAARKISVRRPRFLLRVPVAIPATPF
jgi:hypothetical protein